MFEYRENSETSTLEVMIDGHITADDYHTMAQKVVAFMESHPKIRVLKEIRSFDGLDFGIFKVKINWRHDQAPEGH